MESQKTEWKRQWRNEFLNGICGLANAQGGTLEIGRNDNGIVVGVDNAKELLEELFARKLGNASHYSKPRPAK